MSTEQTKYILNSQYQKIVNADKVINNNIKNKSAVLIVNDTIVPPINPSRSDLPWSLGSKTHPWKNLFISNKKASDLSQERTEVLDVYESLSDSASKASLQELSDEVHNSYATITKAEEISERAATIERPGALVMDTNRDLYGYTAGTEPVQYVYVKATELADITIKLLDGTETSYKGWTTSPSLYDISGNTYEGSDFSIVQLGTKFPGVYDPDQDNIYVVIDSANNIASVTTRHITDPKDFAVYTHHEKHFAFAPIASTEVHGIVSVDGETVNVDSNGCLYAYGNVMAILGDE